MEFGIAEFAAHLIKLSVGGVVLNDSMLEWVGNKVEKAAKAKFGEYQDQAGPFSAWEDLAESTVAEKDRLGYFGQRSDEDPLLRSGETMDSIQHKVGFQQVVIGSDSQILEWLELGTPKMPARSTLGGAAFEQTPEIVEKLGVAMEAYLIGENVFRGKLKIE